MLCKTRKWGSSLGVFIPKEKAEELHLKPDEEVEVTLEKRSNVLKEMFGTLPKLKEINLEEIRKELESKYWKR